jgi:hypothetical protein
MLGALRLGGIVGARGGFPRIMMFVQKNRTGWIRKGRTRKKVSFGRGRGPGEVGCELGREKGQGQEVESSWGGLKSLITLMLWYLPGGPLSDSCSQDVEFFIVD